MVITDDTPVTFLTVRELREVLRQETKEETKDTAELPRYVYGIKGIRQLFNVSHDTACKYKNTIIKDAVYQQGRVIVTDTAKALDLFSKHKIKGGKK